MSRKIYLPTLGIWEDIDDEMLLSDVPRIIDGVVVDPVTGNGPLLVGPAHPLAPGAPTGPYVVAATSSQSGVGTIGTMASTPTANDTITKIMKVTAPAGARAVTISWYCPSGLACSRLWVCVQPLEGDSEAAAKLSIRGGEVFPLNTGESISFGVTPTDADLTYVYLVAEYASGSLYTDASAVVQWWSQGRADQITTAFNGQVLNRIVSPYLYIPLMHSGSTTGKVTRYSNVTGLSSELNITGTEDYTTRVPMLTLNETTCVLDRTQPMADFASLGTGIQMLLFANVYFVSPVSGAYAVSMSNVTPTGEIYGGYGLALTGAVQMRVKWQPNGDANGDLPGSSLTIAAATRYSVMLAFDCRNEVVRTFINGTESALCAMTFPSNSANARYPIIKAAEL